MTKPTEQKTKGNDMESAELLQAGERISELEGKVKTLESELDTEIRLSLKQETDLNDWQSLAVRVSATLLGITEQRISHMLTESRMAEIIRQNNSVLFNIAGELRAKLEKE